jgi:hypothetical protein
MSNPIVVLVYDPDLDTPGSYCLIALTPEQWQGRTLSARVKAPCGHIGTLLDHTIGSDGIVSPSLQCTHEGCNFHAYARLDGWHTHIPRSPDTASTP